MAKAKRSKKTSVLCDKCKEPVLRTTIINFIIDESGSMHSCWDDTIGGFNTFVEKQKEDKLPTLLSLVKFCHEVTVVYTSKKLEDVPILSRETYHPSTSTALLDAIGETIQATEKTISEMSEKPKVLFVIMTDGLENSSRKFNKNQIIDMISAKEKTGDWTFTYMGADMDAIASASSIGISACNSINFCKGDMGSAIRGLSHSTTLYKTSGGIGGASANFYQGSETVADLLTKTQATNPPPANLAIPPEPKK